MKKTVSILIVVLFTIGSVFAQKTNDNGSTGGNNNNNTPQDKPQNNDNNGGNTSDGLLLQFTKIVFGAYQQVLISKRSNDPTVFGLEAGVNGGILSGNNESFFRVDPRVRYNKGALSFEARYDYLTTDPAIQNLDVLAEFNIIAGKGFKTAIGQGIMYNVENAVMYHESFLEIDLGLNNKQIIVSPEFRLAYDWSVRKSVNTEVSLKGAYRILNLSSVAVYLNAGGGYRYTGGYNYTDIFGGLNLIF